MTTTITSPYLVILYIQQDDKKIRTHRRQFTDEATAEIFAVDMLGADTVHGLVIGTTLFFMNEDGTMNTLNEWEF